MVLCINLLKSIPKLATRTSLSLSLSISLCLRHGSLQGTQSWIWFFLLLIHLSFSCSFFNFFKNIMGVDHTNVTCPIVHRLWYYNLFDTTQNIWDLNYFFSHTSCIFQLKYFKIYIYIYLWYMVAVPSVKCLRFTLLDYERRCSGLQQWLILDRWIQRYIYIYIDCNLCNFLSFFLSGWCSCETDNLLEQFKALCGTLALSS